MCILVVGGFARSRLGAPRSTFMYNGWESRMVRFSQPPLSSLGADQVTVSLSVGRRGSRPKAKVEDVEPRNYQKEKGRCLRVSRRQYWTERYGEYSLASPGSQVLACYTQVQNSELGRPCRLFFLSMADKSETRKPNGR